MKTYEKAVRVIEEAPEAMKEALRKGELSIPQAYQQIQTRAKKAAVEERIKEYAKVQTGITDITTTKTKYNIIYADPAWSYWSSGNSNQSLHYPTMSIDDICALPVKEIADDNSALFLWVTYPILQDAFKVIEAWGFKYSTAAFVWVKTNKRNDEPFMGLGSWTRANSELCLLSTRGQVIRLDAGISQIVSSPSK